MGLDLEHGLVSEQEERIAERIMIASVSLSLLRHNANVRKEERQLTVERKRKERRVSHFLGD